jgi:diguanylate cyclase (GGDEF)-like protein
VKTKTKTRDDAVLRAALEVYRALELPAQLETFGRIAVEWSGGAAFVALGRDEEAGGFAPLATTLPADDARLLALRAVGRAREVPLPVASERWERVGPVGDLPGAPKASLAVPLRDGRDGTVALLLVFDPTADAGARLDELAAASRDAFGNAAQVRAIRELTIRDDTAECFNRRHFEEFLVEEMARSNRFKTPLSLIFFDMDNLKEVNNRLGHAMGSRTLLEVSQRVRAKIRKFDKLFRFGGDEFCIVLPETEWHGALEVAERVREAISSRPMLQRELGPTAGQPMTASFGIASFPLHARAKEELVVRADRAMQSVKAGKKNSIAVADLEDASRG